MAIVIFFALVLGAAAAVAYPLLPGQMAHQKALGLAEADIDSAVQSLRQARRLGRQACPACGTAYRPGDRFCVVCGGQLSERASGTLVCASCGAPLQEGDRFCAKCGHSQAEAGAQQALPPAAAGGTEGRVP